LVQGGLSLKSGIAIPRQRQWFRTIQWNNGVYLGGGSSRKEAATGGFIL
jgi:hypothetical protein